MSLSTTNSFAASSFPLLPYNVLAYNYRMTVVVNHNYPQTAALRVLRQDGTPIEGALISVYNANRYYGQNLSQWITQQNIVFSGAWVSDVVFFGDPDDSPTVFQTSWAGGIYTDVNGEWLSDLLLPEAQTWLLKIEKLPEYTPRFVEVTT